jgi:hypothetical protein
MAGGKPANKRLFHLVFERTQHAGGAGPHELKNQVVDFAVDLKQITESFSSHADSDFQQLIREALQTALDEAATACASYEITNPL